HYAHWRRVPSGVPTARAAQRLSADSILRMAGEPKACPIASTVPSSTGYNGGTSDLQFRATSCSRMSQVRWPNAIVERLEPREIHNLQRAPVSLVIDTS